MKHKFVYLMSVVCIMTSCFNENFNQSTITPGQEVSFSANLAGTSTRTTYDPVGIANSTGSVKVNWTQGDLISVYGTTCAVKQAEYSVDAALDGNGAPTNYATSLNKTGAAGIQWGTESESDFFAIYPSTESAFTPTDNGVQVRTSIRTLQKNHFKYDAERNCWVGTPYLDNVERLTMPDALMFAATSASASAESVDLNFKPWSTVLKFKFMGFKYSNVGTQQQTVSIRRIVLTAPSNVDIAGELDLEISLPQYSDKGEIVKQAKAVASPEGTSIQNEIIIEPDYLPLSQEQSVEFCVFTIPQPNQLSFGTDDSTLWKVRIESTDGQSFTYLMRPSSGNANLIAGEIHNITIPVKPIDKPGDLTDFKDKWIEKIPRNVYLAELSLPGSWYCTDKNYSGYTANNVADGIKELYDAGVRAFHIDCRLSKKSQNNLFGSATYDDGETDVYLAVAGTESISGIIGQGRINEGQHVLDMLTTICSKISKTEYVVVVLTIAQEPFIDSGSKFGTNKPKYVLPAIQNVLNDSSLANYLYTTPITANTLVNDVLGRMVVLVNANNSNFTDYFTAPALIAEASLASSPSGEIAQGVFTDMQERDLYWGNQDSKLTYFYHHSQRTATDVTGFPDYNTRQNAILDIIEESDDIYKNSTHDAWYLMGIGGYRKNSTGSESHTEVAEKMNDYLLKLIDKKLKKEDGYYPSPVGIVLMNRPLNSDYKGPELVEAIMNMNASFNLSYDPTKPEWPNTQQAAKNGAYAIVGENAF